MKLRLFALRDISTGKVVPELFFTSKPEAKKERDARGGPTKFSVTTGPDHRRHPSKVN